MPFTQSKHELIDRLDNENNENVSRIFDDFLEKRLRDAYNMAVSDCIDQVNNMQDENDLVADSDVEYIDREDTLLALDDLIKR